MDVSTDTESSPKERQETVDIISADHAIDRHRLTLKELFPLEQPRKSDRNYKLPLVLSLVLMATVGAFIADPAYQTESLTTPIGGHQKAMLADGSQLTLNTNTQVDIEWHLRSRRVTLHKGEVIFDVSHMQYRPFYVLADRTTIKVVGTMFDVLRKSDEITVTVLRGKVQVSGVDQHNYTNLIPGQQIVSINGSVAMPVSVDANNAVAWSEGKFVFEHTPLLKALAEVQRYRNSPITLENIDAGKLQISGVFRIDQADMLLRLLPSILPVTVRYKTGNAVVVSGK